MPKIQHDGPAHAAPPAALPILTGTAAWNPPKASVVPLPPAVLPAAIAAGIGVLVLLPLDRPGLGWVLSGLILAAAVFVVDRRARGDAPRHFTPASALWAATALALLAVGFVRASGWLFVLCVIAAFVTGSLAVVGRRTVNTIFYEVLAVPIEALLALPWIRRAFTPKPRTGGRERRSVLLAVGASLLLLAVFVPLLAGADATFADLVSSMTPEIRVGTVFRWILVFSLAGLGVVGACYVLASPPPPALGESPRRRLAHRLEWTLPLGVLVALFAVFVGVRLVVLFGGTGYVLRTGGLTSAEYARSGFWQLCTITVLTLALVAAALRWAPVTEAADRAWQRGLLGALSALSLVLVASALSRMWTYQQAYGFTVLRLLVEVCELWLGALFVLVLLSLVRLRPQWLPRAAIGAAAAALLALAVLNPEGFIADRNIDRAAHGKELDTRYLAGFSTDVVSAVDRLPEPRRSCVLRPVVWQLDADGWQAWNLSRAGARQVVSAPPPVPSPC
ncbi:DUF4153 domain-containing protein [Amycolatopsis sp. H20-H5]|uniref:DUF4153 domain-containing protein n=1 Tax=Amycolatopsis sp. H20-H5 TaxID=3046309 RepID=UPI002DB70356|nr:DUF4173 domain-containing protein [Amycolatopsis sp. H20-H5]MEC3977228.1 DUF4173 domain-containing protein [Amycolatopsis sp. H20-H5]